MTPHERGLIEARRGLEVEKATEASRRTRVAGALIRRMMRRLQARDYRGAREAAEDAQRLLKSAAALADSATYYALVS